MTARRSQSLRALAVSVIVLGALALYVVPRLTVTTDVSLLLPAGEDREVLSVLTRVADSELARSMVLTLGAPDLDSAVAAGRALEDALRQQPAVQAQLASLEGGPSSGSERAIYELYHPRRLAFFAPDPESVAAATSVEALQRSAAALKVRLSQPLSPLLSQLAPSDPTLSIMRLFERVQASQGASLGLHDGRFVTRGEPYAVLFLRTRARAFDSGAQGPFLAGVQAAFEGVNARWQGRLQLDQSGANRFAVRMEQQINQDLSRVSTLSMVGLGLVMFRGIL